MLLICAWGRGRNGSACFSSGFYLLQNLTEIYQDGKGEGEKNTLAKVSDYLSPGK